MSDYALGQFQILRPQHETSQEKGLEWLAKAHAISEMKKQNETDNTKQQAYYQEYLQKFSRIGCKPEHINKRGHELADFLHEDWQNMSIFHYDLLPQGASLEKRQKLHSVFTENIFSKFYPTDSSPPCHLIHVSCTGYESPSAAQKLVSKKGWNTQVTHAYHMGCYASIPAIRMASALVHQQGKRADIVHTELCTLHFDPSNHESDQIVLQSLFADGYIKYSVLPLKNSDSQLQILYCHEQLLPNCIEAMTWNLHSFGFMGTLSKKIPFLIATNIKTFLHDFALKAGVDYEDLIQKAVFAIHPGGPKILDYIAEILDLRPEQLHYSREILRQYGNVSSGTLPHIWEAITNDANVSPGTLVMSLAFGPGLTIAGILLKKV